MGVADLPISLDRERIERFCQAHGIRVLSLFGSVLREDFDPEHSDVDVLAEFAPGALHGVGWNYLDYGRELSAIFGRKVDFCSKLRPWLRERVEQERLLIYEQA